MSSLKRSKEVKTDLPEKTSVVASAITKDVDTVKTDIIQTPVIEPSSKSKEHDIIVESDHTQLDLKKDKETPTIDSSDQLTDSKKSELPDIDVGTVLVFGTGDAGQLGLGEDIVERKKPFPIKSLDNVVQIAAGGMHSVALTKLGQIFTWGCNDDNALGRPTSDTTPASPNSVSEYEPGIADISILKNETVKQISAGDSHTAVLTDNGLVYTCGTFRDSAGKIGMISKFSQPSFIEVFKPINEKAIKIASGNDHILILTDKGNVYSFGCGEQGQLGYVSKYFTDRGGRRGLSLFYKPKLVYIRKYVKGARKTRKPAFITDIYCGSYCSFAIDENNTTYGWGLNNFGQLAHSSSRVKNSDNNTISDSDIVVLNPTPLSFIEQKFNSKIKIASGQHHSLFFNAKENMIYSCGRSSYGRLGIGETEYQVIQEPTLVILDKNLEQNIKGIACGETTSYCFTEFGNLYSWGMGSCLQLGADNEDDKYNPYKLDSKYLNEFSVIDVAAGGQHVVLLCKNK